MIVVVLSPHRDDAAFSLTLAIRHWLREGTSVSVLNCFTQSEYAPYSDADALHPNDRLSYVSALRKREDLDWNKRLAGRLSFHDLDLLDAPVRLASSVDEVFRAEIRPGDRALARVQGAISKVLRRAAPGDVAMLIPLALGGHIDHRIVREAAFNVLQSTDEPSVAAPVAFYEDLPYASYPGQAEAIPAAVRELPVALEGCFACAPANDPEAAAAEKSDDAQCYDSQIDSEVARAIGAFSMRYNGRERLWGNAAWCSHPGLKVAMAG